MATLEQAVNWARKTRFSASDIDCTTAVVLKILDRKCKMESVDMHAVVGIYDVIKTQPGHRISAEFHRAIELARSRPTDDVMLHIHTLRVSAEALIDKPVMKAYKRRLKQGLSAFSSSQHQAPVT